MSSQRHSVCERCYSRISGQQQTPIQVDQETIRLLNYGCFSQVEHANTARIDVIVDNGAVFPASYHPPPFVTNPLPPFIPNHSAYSPEYHPNQYQPSFPHIISSPPSFASPQPYDFAPYGFHYPTQFSAPMPPYTVPLPYQRDQSNISIISSDRNIGNRRSEHDSYDQRSADPPSTDMDLPLTLESYRKKFKALLHYEEKEHVALLAKNCNGQYKVSAVSEDEAYILFYDSKFDCFFAIHEISPNQILYASQACGEVHIVCSPSEYLKGTIIRNYEHNSDILYFGMYESPGQKMGKKLSENDSKTFEVKFMIKHAYFKGLHQSLNGITREALKRIIPSHDDFEEGLNPVPSTDNLPVDELDIFQCDALHTMAYSKSSAPVIIPGPFGSGKTRLLAVAAKYFINNAKQARERCRILLCCCQQDSADIFMRDYFLKMSRQDSSMEIVRVASQTHRRGYISEHVVQLDTLKSRLDYYRSRRHIVVVSTFMTALRLTECFQPGYFTHIMIDEGAQAREPECIAPLSMAIKSTRIIIAGDSKQVGPKLSVLGKAVNEKGLGKSLMERLYEQYASIGKAKSYCITLYNNYRCLPEILQLCSDLFYQSSLVPCARVPRIKEYALHFICVEATAASSADCENVIEAEIIIKEVKQLIVHEYIDTTNICIMCCSQRQANLIREKLRLKELKGVKVLTSYQMQGQEFDVLFLSTIESITKKGLPFDPLKSFCDPAVFNTAMTRARSLIVAVGNPETLVTTEKAMGSSYECWHKFIQKCQLNHTYDRHRAADTAQSEDEEDIDERKPPMLQDFTVNLAIEQQLSKVTTITQKVERQENSRSSEPVITTSEARQQSNKSPSSEPVRKQWSQRDTSPPVINYDEHFPPLGSSGNIYHEQNTKSKSKNQQKIENNEIVLTDEPNKQECTVEPVNPLASDLTPENYKDKFHCLLEMEEREHTSILRNKCDGVYEFSFCHNRDAVPSLYSNRNRFPHYGYIQASHLDADKVSYAKQASEGVVLTYCYNNNKKMRSDKTECLTIVRTIFEKGNERIYLGLESGDFLLLNNVFKKVHCACIEVSAEFVLKYSYFNRLHEGLNHLSTNIIRNKLIPCQRTDFFSKKKKYEGTYMIPCVQKYVKLDMKEDICGNPQTKALHKILNADCSKAPILVIGSFGTGKTRLLARAAYQILQNDKSTKVLICAHHQRSVDKMLENYFGEMIDAGWYFENYLTRLIPEGHYEINPQFEKYYCTLQQLKKKPKDHLRLVLTTFSSSLSLYKLLGRRHFTHILLDEGAQSREPESIIPLCLAMPETKIVIAGDHKQVGPSLLVLGDEAREQGLKMSLLERLYSIYESPDLLGVSEDHSATLLTNFRCHHALLSLPSYLFYGSALVTVAEATKCLHPDALYPIHFLCSDLSEETVEVTESQNEREVLMVLAEVKKYVDYNKWPREEWGDRNLKDICIMATTANQKSLFSDKLRNTLEYQNINGVEVLTVYDIQGQEFQAVFLSTAEPTDEEGMSKNPTKSPCGQYVFNTAITRAKSLVVCVGNPFLLLKIEQKMKNEQNFWRDYMKRCIIAKTFHIHDSSLTGKSITEVYKNLQTEIFADYKSGYVPDEERAIAARNDDPIINKLQEIIKQQPHYKRCKLQIYNQQQNDQIWKIAETAHERRHNIQTELVFKEKVDCELVTTTRRDAYGLPLDTKQERIVINGFKNRRGAFNGDIVTVGVLGEHAGQRYGKVVNLIEARHATKYVCTADSQNMINFYPLDRVEPVIVNLPKLSKYILQCKPTNTKTVDAGSLSSSESPSSRHITVFEESSLDVKRSDDIFPVVKELVPLEMAPSLLFVVKVLSWAPQYRKPLGAVISAIPRTNSMFIMEGLLEITHNIQQDADCKEQLTRSGDEEALITNPASLEVPSPESAVLISAGRHVPPISGFTIDSEDSINLDDALSITCLSENCWKMTVLITDVTKVIQKDSELDRRAKRRGTSVYGLRCTHMLPVNLSKDRLSLLPDRQRDAIAISTKVQIVDGVVTVEDDCEIKNVQMKSLIRLTYSEAQSIIIKETSNHVLQEKQDKFNSRTVTNMTLDESLILLYKAAMMLCVKRIGDAGYFSNVTDPGEEENWHSTILVSELMIWANNEIAKFVYKNIPNYTILRKQLSPLPDKVDLIKKVHRHALNYSISLRSALCDAKSSASHQQVVLQQQEPPPLLIRLGVWEKLRDSILGGNMEVLRNLLADDNHYSQLAIAMAALRSTSSKAEYVKSQPPIVLTDDEGNVIKGQSPYYHYGLKLDVYTHFTSPIRRYPDIVMQRFVNMILGRSDISYSELELQDLCTHLNQKLKSASKFELDVKKIELATGFEESLDQVEAYLTKSLEKQHKYELHIPSVKYKRMIRGQDTHFDQSKLNCLKREESCITWRVILVPFEAPNYLFNASKFSQFREFDRGSSIDLAAAGTVQANVFSHNEDTTSDTESANVRRKRCLYVSKLTENIIKVDKDTWELCNTFVKKCSLMEGHDRLHESLQDLQPLFVNQTATCEDVKAVPSMTESPVICLDLSRNFDIGEIINVWMGRNIAKPIPVPGVDLIEVAPSAKVCLQHNKAPAMCFSDTKLKLASRCSYRSEEEYVELWCKALLAEASYDAVSTSNLVVLTDVPLKWPSLERPDNCLDNVYFKPKGDLVFKIDEKQLNLLDFVFKVKILAGDLVCARYIHVDKSVPHENVNVSPHSSAAAIYHFVIHNVKAEDNKSKDTIQKTISMRPVGDHGCRVSVKWKSIIAQSPDHAPPHCELQIIKMPVSFNRLFYRLQSMNSRRKWSKLAINVALGRKFHHQIQNAARYMNLLQTNPKCLTLWNGRNKKLNQTQELAIERALQSSFSLIQGPPGTGKSIVGAHLAYTFAMGNRLPGTTGCVMYCGPSNKAVDVVHDYFQKLNESSTNDRLRILRLYGRTHEKLDLKDPLIELKIDVEDSESKCKERFKKDALHCKIRQKGVEIKEIELHMKSLLSGNIIPSHSERIRLKQMINSLEEDILCESYDVILCTCNETCSKRVSNHLNGRIAQCIIDECGMANEPETLTAMSLAEHVVLIGDHKQLQPVVKHEAARQCGLVKSLFERYAEMPNMVTFTILNTQYRMHSHICEVPSDLYYDSKLKADDSILRRQPVGHKLNSFWPQGNQWPIMFCDVIGEENDLRTGTVSKGKTDSHSKYNEEEVKKTMEIVRRLIKDHHLNSNGSKDIAVLTPYKAQKNKLMEELKKSDDPGVQNVVVSSIIESQGDEYNIVIVNTVRSLPLEDIIDRKFVQPDLRWMTENLGFVIDPHQINVGITRAKHGLIIIGNRVLLSYNEDWDKLISYYNEHHCIR